ncbi:hypothetical protein IE81DRAFT_323983 [Ceraceosorus guamensis]|uniref:Zn(2)-C6 fungal-type domain-containing protein n=1 Tax=Ceraceosorus guamensis TaxID=1522189 RepID=A0A316VWX6_9BASI|nr:hypothetical protein IE81DRAFT_323983 [Ceraceosorus guamensis]PWN41980.1 hypothetical protein IE81DRAFT_323983 [Ceraceosorus guamensis]
MYPGSQPSQATGGQHSAFSHPPNLHGSNFYGGPQGGSIGSPSTPPYNTQGWPPGSAAAAFGAPAGVYSPAGNSRNFAGGSSLGHTWSPAGGVGSDAPQVDGDEDEDDEEDEEDEEDEDDDDDDEEQDQSSGKKRKRSGDKGKANGAGNGKGSGAGSSDKKAKPTRGAKACTNCRRLKMRCVGAEQGPPCARCKHGGHNCVFEESNRGKKGGKNQRAEAMAQSLRKMEATLNSVLMSLRDPTIAAGGGTVTRSPSPTREGSRPSSGRHFKDRPGSLSQAEDRERRERGWAAVNEADEYGRPFKRRPGTIPPLASASNAEAAASPGGKHVNPSALAGRDDGRAAGTQAAPESGARFAVPAQPARGGRRHSPRLHSLPDSTLTPLGLLAEASLHNHERSKRLGPRLHRHTSSSTSVSESSPASSSVRLKRDGEEAEEHGTPATVNVAIGAGSPDDAGKASVAASSGSGSREVKGLSADDSSEGAGLDRIASKQYPAPPDEYVDFPGAERAKQRPGEKNAATYNPRPNPDEVAVSGLGVASDTYFKPGPMNILPLRRIVIERELPPELLTSGTLTSQEVLELFQIFFHFCSHHCVILDPEWHTPTMICSRSPFLFTVICMIGAKFYPKRPELYAKCLLQAQKSAYLIMARGYKSVEIVQGFLLLALWNQPAARFEEDKTWLFSGVAIRMATDLNLHRKSVASLPGNLSPDDPAVLDREREIINRERTWLMCFSVDRSISGQMGKPWTIREDWIIRNSRHWCMQRLSQPWDLGISALVELLRLTSRQVDFLYSSTTSVSGLNTELEYSSILRIYNEQIEEWRDTWRSRGFFGSLSESDGADGSFPLADGPEAEAAKEWREAEAKIPAEDTDHHKRTMHFITKQAPLRYHYAVLVINSFGLQHAVDFPRRSGLDKGWYFARCYNAAKGIVTAAGTGLRSVLSYSPETHFVIITYACVFLLKLARPTFSAYVDEEEVLGLVGEGANLLEAVALSPTHTPALYSGFLRTLLQTRREASATNRSSGTTPYNQSRANSAEAEANGGEVDGAGANPSRRPSLGGAVARALEGKADDGPSSSNAFSNMGGQGSASGFATPSMNITPAQKTALSGLDPATLGGIDMSNPHLDQLNLDDSFWSQLLPPGFGGTLSLDGTAGLDGLMGSSAAGSGGGNGQPLPAFGSSAQGHASGIIGLTPSQTRSNSPHPSSNFTNVQFDLPPSSVP